MNTWDMIRSERASLSDALATIPESDWSKPSLCDNWTVRDVVAHMIATAQMSPPKFFGKMAISGFNFQTMTGKEIRRVSAGRSNPELVGAYRYLVDAHSAPPGPALTWLGETIVHGEDIFRAIDGYREHPTDHVIAVADFYKGSNLMTGAKRRIAGVTLKATDADWIHGAGPVATGPAIALVMVMTGRRPAPWSSAYGSAGRPHHVPGAAAADGADPPASRQCPAARARAQGQSFHARRPDRGRPATRGPRTIQPVRDRGRGQAA